jgi:hypothetical protein
VCEGPWRMGWEVRDIVRLMLSTGISLRVNMGVAMVSRYSRGLLRSLFVSGVADGPKQGREGLTVEEADDADDARLRERPRSGRSTGGVEKSK